MKLNKTFGVLALIVFGALVFIYFITKGPVGDSSISETFLLGNCKEFAANDNRIGMPYETSYSVATKIKGADVVAAGKKIVGVRMNIGGDSVKNCEAFIGIDYKNPTTKKSFEYKKGGWNVVIFDEPIDVTNDDIYVGYNLTATGSVLGYENANSNFEDEMLFVDGAWDTMYNTTDIKGLWSIQLIMAEGDYSSFVQNDILVESHNAALTSRVGNDLKMSCEVRNNGIKSVENIKVKCSLAGSVQEVVIPGSLINGQSYFAQFSMEAPDAVGDQKIEFSVETPDFKDENVENNIAQINHKIFALSAQREIAY